jgi:hypothetical protein
VGAGPGEGKKFRIVAAQLLKSSAGQKKPDEGVLFKVDFFKMGHRWSLSTLKPSSTEFEEN